MDKIPIITLNDSSHNILDSNDPVRNSHPRLISRGRVGQTFDRSLLAPSPDRSRRGKNHVRSHVKLKSMGELKLEKERERERAKLEEEQRAKEQPSAALSTNPSRIPRLRRVSMRIGSPSATTSITVTATAGTTTTVHATF